MCTFTPISNCERHTNYFLSIKVITECIKMSMTKSNKNMVPVESSTALMVHILIDGKEILWQALWNEEVGKGVLMGWTHVEPKNVQALNEITFLATYAVGIMADEIWAAIEKIENWLGKPVVITCNDITAAQAHHVLECT